jgi:hypothetical protein
MGFSHLQATVHGTLRSLTDRSIELCRTEARLSILTEPFGQHYWWCREYTGPTMEAPQFADTKRWQIVEGARSVFLAQGFDGASMKDIARAASVSTGTLYFYFTSKEQVFAAIVQSECMTHMSRREPSPAMPANLARATVPPLC